MLKDPTLEAERILAGSLVRSGADVLASIADLEPDDFLDPTARGAFSTARALLANGTTATLADIVRVLKERHELDAAKGAAAVAALVDDLPALKNLAPWARIVREAATCRRLGVFARSDRPFTEILAEARRLIDRAETSGEWPAPLSLGASPVLPPFPIAALPSELAGYVAEVSRAFQVPDLAGILALGVIAAAASKKLEVRVREEWKEPLALWCACFLPPGSRKSGVFSEILRPLEDFEREEVARTRSDIARAEEGKRLLEVRLRRAREASAKGKGKPGEDPHALADELSRYGLTAPPRLLVGDATPERLAQMMAEQGGRICLASPEAPLFGLLEGRYSDAGPNLDVLLSGHAGEQVRVDRMGRPPLIIKEAALSVIVTPQPAILERLAGDPYLLGRGVWARFLMALPVSNIGTRNVSPDPVDNETRERFRCRVRELLELQGSRDAAGELVPQEVTLSHDASVYFRAFEKGHEKRLAGDLASIAAWGSKAPGAVARLALALHAYRYGAAASGETIVRADVVAAVELIDYFASHARGILVERANPQKRLATELLSWLKRERLATFTPRDAQRHFAGRASVKKREDLREPLELLESHGWIRRAEEPEGKRGRRSEVFEVHPEARHEVLLRS